MGASETDGGVLRAALHPAGADEHKDAQLGAEGGGGPLPRTAAAPPPPPQHVPPNNKWASALAHNMHFLTFVPLVLVQILQDVDLSLAAALSVAVVLAALLGSWLLHRRGYVTVFPKPMDIFNLQLYISIVILANVVLRWMHDWLSVYICFSNAAFMWGTILLPDRLCECFVMHSMRDSMPAAVAAHPLARRMAAMISVGWAAALTVMGAAALPPAVGGFPPERTRLVVVLCSYVLGFGPMLVALIWQFYVVRKYRPRLRAAFALQAQQAGGGGGGGRGSGGAAQQQQQQGEGRQPGGGGGGAAVYVAPKVPAAGDDAV